MDRSQQSREMNEIIDEVNSLLRVNMIYWSVFWVWIVFSLPFGVLLLTVMKMDLSIEGVLMIYIGGAIAIWIAKSVQGRSIQPAIEIRDRMYEEYNRNRPS